MRKHLRQMGSHVFFLAIGLTLGLSLNACSVVATRPVQEMSDTIAALRAAKEVQADTLAPELYRQASEWHFKAKHEYKFKNFKLAKEYASKARRLAEQAEFEAIRSGETEGLQEARLRQMPSLARSRRPIRIRIHQALLLMCMISARQKKKPIARKGQRRLFPMSRHPLLQGASGLYEL